VWYIRDEWARDREVFTQVRRILRELDLRVQRRLRYYLRKQWGRWGYRELKKGLLQNRYTVLDVSAEVRDCLCLCGM